MLSSILGSLIQFAAVLQLLFSSFLSLCIRDMSHECQIPQSLLSFSILYNPWTRMPGWQCRVHVVSFPGIQVHITRSSLSSTQISHHCIALRSANGKGRGRPAPIPIRRSTIECHRGRERNDVLFAHDLLHAHLKHFIC